MITSNLVFSEWNKIFKEPRSPRLPALTASSITVLSSRFGKEIKSLRMEEAAQRNQQSLPQWRRQTRMLGNF
ncbi:MAG: hypothetical protein R3A44_22335 [Caldilineaceae bacterium]